MRTWVSTSTHSYVQTKHVLLRLLYSSPFDGIGHKTGTRGDQVKNTHLLPQNSSRALAPWSYPDLIPAGLEPSKLNLDTSKYICSRRQVYLWIIAPLKRANKRVRHAFDQSMAWWLVGCGFHMVLECRNERNMNRCYYYTYVLFAICATAETYTRMTSYCTMHSSG